MKQLTPAGIRRKVIQFHRTVQKINSDAADKLLSIKPNLTEIQAMCPHKWITLSDPAGDKTEYYCEYCEKYR
jgi:hypothetical protein